MTIEEVSVFTNAKILTFCLAPGRKFCRVKHDYELWGKSRLEGIPAPDEHPKAPTKVYGLPEVHKLIESERVWLTEPLAWMWYGLLEQYAPPTMTRETLIEAWLSLTSGSRAFTNKSAWDDGYHDFVSGLNPGKQPMRLEPIVTGGAVLEIVGEPAVKGLKKELCYPIRTINALKPLEYETITRENGLVFPATIITRESLPDGTRRVTQFWQLNGNDVPVPVICNKDINYIPVRKVFLLDGYCSHPYNP